MVVQAVTFGDVNGDGELEVVFGTTSGYLYAVSGKTGLNIPNFPFKTHGRIAASVLITQLSQGLSQQLVVMSFDGHLYMVDGISGVLCCCAVLCCAALCCVTSCINGCTNVCCTTITCSFSVLACLCQSKTILLFSVTLTPSPHTVFPKLQSYSLSSPII